MVLLVTACVATPYPSQWVRIEAADTSGPCKPVAGVFSQDGEVVHEGVFGPPKTRGASLGKLLFDMQDWGENARVDIRFSDGKSSVVVMGGGNVLISKVFQPGEIKCRAGAWYFEGDWTTASGGVGVVPPATGASKIERSYRQSMDGSLVVEQYESLAGIVMLVPIYGSTRSWFRFPPATEAKR